MKKILIALDYDPTAQKVAEQGYTLAKAMGAEVILMHVVNDHIYYTTTDFSPIMGYGGFMDIDKFQPTLENLKTASLHYCNGFAQPKMARRYCHRKCCQGCSEQHPNTALHHSDKKIELSK